jgi:predicted metal-dependent phosphoesterase TrpH
MLKAICLIIFALAYCIFGATSSRVVIGAQAEKNLKARPFERVVHLTPLGANESRYVYVPFDVPAHAVRISISYQYDRAKGANTIDIGLFDERSTSSDTDPRGFRGWSGGRRSEFFVSGNDATPGYVPGPTRAGTWRVILGLYQVAPTGVDVALKINIETKKGPRSTTNAELKTKTSVSGASTTIAENSQPESSLPEQKIAGHGERWWRGDLHMHTVHSDGDWTIPGLISSARNMGLDFIVITDHNTASHHAEIDRLSKGLKRLLVMRGEEITTYGGHTNAWGLPSGKWIDFRTHPGDNARISNIAAQAHAAGALISVNHPFVLCGGCAWTYEATARDFDAIEVWNGPWDFTDEPALQMWDKILQSGRRITAIASSDSHRPDTPIGKPATHVAARVLSQATLLRAIRQGRVYLTEKAAGPVITFEAELTTGKLRARWSIGDEVHLSAPATVRFLIATEAVPPDATVSLISNGRVVRSFSARVDNQPEVIEINSQQDSYFRLEIRDQSKTVLALTNPIYVRFRR